MSFSERASRRGGRRAAGPGDRAEIIRRATGPLPSAASRAFAGAGEPSCHDTQKWRKSRHNPGNPGNISSWEKSVESGRGSALRNKNGDNTQYALRSLGAESNLAWPKVVTGSMTARTGEDDRNGHPADKWRSEDGPLARRHAAGLGIARSARLERNEVRMRRRAMRLLPNRLGHAHRQPAGSESQSRRCRHRCGPGAITARLPPVRAVTSTNYVARPAGGRGAHDHEFGWIC